MTHFASLGYNLMLTNLTPVPVSFPLCILPVLILLSYMKFWGFVLQLFAVDSSDCCLSPHFLHLYAATVPFGASLVQWQLSEDTARGSKEAFGISRDILMVLHLGNSRVISCC